VAAVREVAANVTPADATIPLISNRDGQAITNGVQILDRMIDQIALPVRWDLVMKTITDSGTTANIETCPAGTLSAILRRAIPGIVSHPANSPSDIGALTQSDLLNFDLAEAYR
ncbi:MAG: ACP S-malonyltransferase, partial [Actinobacteria bacterium]|nr:ACP S-malonyltransferase [Actinomycetota bacterium]